MIKFFRHIRKKMLSENRFSKYLIYAIGEIVLVVIGILIALQINTINQNRMDSEKEQYYLKGLKAELTENYNQFQTSIEKLELQLETIGTLVTAFSETSTFSQIENLESQLHTLIKVADIDVSNTVFNELNSTGQIALIKNDSLRSEVIRVYQKMINTYEDIDGNLKFVFYPTIFPVLLGSIDSQITENMIKKMQERLMDENHNLEMIQALGFEYQIVQAHLRLIGELRNDIEPVISNIENQITAQ